MDADTLIDHLAHGPELVRTLAGGLSPDEARWRPEEGAWSVVEIVNHLVDEEIEDFRRRVDLALHSPAAPWPPIDPPRWATERGYRERELVPSLVAFAREREVSLRWLLGLEHANWNSAHDHPKIGRLSAADLLASWVAHDLLHVRQIVRRRFEMLAEATKPARIEYAGAW